MKTRFLVILSLSNLVGLSIAWIDSRPNWDDTGISAFLVLTTAIIFGFFASKKPWLIALSVSIWIPLACLISAFNFGGILALIPGFLGAYIGYFIRKQFFKQ